MANHQDAGFLSKLGLDNINAAAQRNKVSGGSSIAAAANVSRSAGRGPLTSLLAGAAGGVGGLISGQGGRGFREFGRDFQQGVATFQEGNLARDLGIPVEDLRAKKDLAQKMQKISLGSGSLDDQIIGLNDIISAANQAGQIDVALKAASMRSDLEKQQSERAKAGLEAEAAAQDLKIDGLVDAFDKDGKSITGSIAVQGGVSGMQFADKDGSIQFKPFGQDLFREDPLSATRNEPVEKRLARLMSKPEREKIRNLVADNQLSLRKFDRVATTIKQLVETDNADQSVLGAAGTIVSKLDNFTRSIRGTASAFFGPGSPKDKGLLSRIKGFAVDPGSEVWNSVQLPEFARSSSAAAQNYRANILDLAYMAARLAEPSNRGLSDNDVKLALKRIAGDTSNPQFMVRRFMEIMGDSAFELETRVSAFHGALEGVSNDRVEKALAGNSLPVYRRRLNDLFNKHGVEINESGQAVFQDLIDSDIQDIVSPEPVSTQEESAADPLEKFLISQDEQDKILTDVGNL